MDAGARPGPRQASGFNPRKPHHWIAFGFGSGLVPRIPGTVGTLAAVPLYLLISPLAWPQYVGLLVAATLVGIWACDRTARDLGDQDPGAIVWDEWTGFLLTMVAAPPGWGWILAGLILFRLLDIRKPWPIGWVDRSVPGGVGIMLDDLVAGAMAAAPLGILAWWLRV